MTVENAPKESTLNEGVIAYRLGVMEDSLKELTKKVDLVTSGFAELKTGMELMSQRFNTLPPPGRAEVCIRYKDQIDEHSKTLESMETRLKSSEELLEDFKKRFWIGTGIITAINALVVCSPYLVKLILRLQTAGVISGS